MVGAGQERMGLVCEYCMEALVLGPLLPVSGVTSFSACRCPCAIFRNPRILDSVRGRPAAISKAVLTSPGFGPRETELAGAP